MSESNILSLAGVIKESIVDGPGYRYTVFCQGCPHHCEGCHNPATHPFEGGTPVSVERLAADIAGNPLLKGVTFSGGEPFCQAAAYAQLARLVHAQGRDVFCYSGYTFEQLLNGANEQNHWMELLREIDTLVDGKFVLKEKSLMLRFRGSRNQRILDVKKSLEAGQAVWDAALCDIE